MEFENKLEISISEGNIHIKWGNVSGTAINAFVFYFIYY